MRADTFYATQVAQPARPRLVGPLEVDTAIVGGGLAGLVTALELARAGVAVAVIEAEALGFGASGRNGGIVSASFANGEAAIAARVGPAGARALQALAIEGVERVRATIRDLGIAGAAPVPGLLHLRRYDRADDLRAWVANWGADWSADSGAGGEGAPGQGMTYLDRAAIRARLATDRYCHGVEDFTAFHIQPLAYLLGIAAEIERRGGLIFEGSALRAYQAGTVHRLRTAKGEVQARRVVFAMGGYVTRVVPALARAVLPIATYMIETEPSDRLAQVIRTRAAVLDDRRASDYFRLVDGGRRLLWGGRISTRDAAPDAVAKSLRAAMHEVFPQLDGIGIARAWSGWMGYARHKMPQVGRLARGAWYITAFGGHGLNTTAVAGKVLAEAMLGESGRIGLFAPWGLAWAGGPLGLAAAQMTYWGLQAQDRWRERGV